MSTASTTPATDRCLIGVPMWVWKTLLAPLAIALVLGAAGWLWSLQGVAATHAQQLTEHEWRLDWQDKMAEKMDAKLDRILERIER